jgi:hypothetical protein
MAADPPSPSPYLSPQAGRGEERRRALLSPHSGERQGEGLGGLAAMAPIA